MRFQLLFSVPVLLLLLVSCTPSQEQYRESASSGGGSAAPAAASGRIVRLATLEWPPYISREQRDHGFVYRIAVEAFRAAGWQAEIRFYPWARALELIRSGVMDGLFPEYYDRSREQNFVYSLPFPGGPVGLMKRRGTRFRYRTDPVKDPERALRGFQSAVIGVVRGYVNTPEFDRATYLTKEDVATDLQNLQKLLAGRVDLIFIDKFVAGYLLVTRLPHAVNEVEFLQPPLAYKPLYIAFSRRKPGFQIRVDAFNLGLRLLQQSGRLRKIVEEAGFVYRTVP